MKKSELRQIIREEIQKLDEAKVIQTGEKTFNKAVFAKIKELFPTVSKYEKRTVPYIGPVIFVKDRSGKLLGKVVKDQKKDVEIYLNEVLITPSNESYLKSVTDFVKSRYNPKTDIEFTKNVIASLDKRIATSDSDSIKKIYRDLQSQISSDYNKHKYLKL